jgi:dihydroorotase
MSLLLSNCILSGQVVNIHIDGEFIAKIGAEKYEHTREIDLKRKIVIPGMIDLHTHIRDMKQSYKEDWVTAGRAALAGGVTTVFDMPDTIPPTSDANNYQIKKGFARKSAVNFGIYAGATPDNFSEMKMFLDEEANIAGIKIYLESSNTHRIISDEEMLKRFFILAKQYNKPVLVHCEDQNDIHELEEKYRGTQYNSVKYHNMIHTAAAAVKALKRVLAIADEVRGKLIVSQVSSADEIKVLREHKKNCDYPLYCEVTPHHLLLNESDLPFCGLAGKVNPPLRTFLDNDALWQALDDGIIDVIASNHAPHSIDEKDSSYYLVPSGFPGLETTLPLLINESIASQRLSIEDIVRLTSGNPAKIMNLYKRGQIKEGYYADIAVIDPARTWEIDPSTFESKAKYSPFEGRAIKGKISFTIVNGKPENQQGKEVEFE